MIPSDPKQLQLQMEQVLDLCKECDLADVRIDTSYEALSRFANNNIQQNVAQTGTGLTLVLKENGRQATGNTNRLDKDSLRRLVESTRFAASKQKPMAEDVPLVAACPTAHKDSLDPATAELSPEEKARDIGLICEAAREQEMVAHGIYRNGYTQFAMANSAGLYCSFQSSSAAVSATVEGVDSTGWAEQENRKASVLQVGQVAQEATEIALRSRNPQPLEPGVYEVVLPPAGVADLLMFLSYSAFNAKALQDGTSPMAGKLGQKLFSEHFSLSDDFAHPLIDGMPFDFEGVSRQAVKLIERGVFSNPVYDLSTAKKAGTVSTGHGLPRPNSHGPVALNLVIEPGSSSLEEMIANTKRGLLVTHLHYTNMVDPSELTLTGMTRDGLFLIENGKLSHPVRNMRFTDSLYQIFGSISAVGHEQQYHGGFFGGGGVLSAIKVDRFRMSSESSF